MPEEQRRALDRIVDLQIEHTNLWNDYWNRYSGFQTWPFWVHAAMTIVPLIVLFFAIDKRRALQIGFYGFNVHAWYAYLDVLGVKYGLWEYPYQLYAPMPITLSLDTSFVPVAYMLAYQWTITRQKNYYLYVGLLSAAFAFGFKPIYSYFDFILLMRGTNYFTLFAGYVVIMLLSKWITNLFVYWAEKKENITYV
ncbi:CBO0543 family protein [Paenibacillus thermotolerans]|uniref:CBO0543 family protein n=1 Tax=Paenibacillus thermotolerans TaxID=3027807 RepID=UPI002368E350|nr:MULTISPECIES: CBO0543 family protein [unclassified Paenibacillus]